MKPDYDRAATLAAEAKMFAHHLIAEQFLPYFCDLFEFYRYASHKDGSALADLENYMEGYIE